jgi:hypothetical protein
MPGGRLPLVIAVPEEEPLDDLAQPLLRVGIVILRSPCVIVWRMPRCRKLGCWWFLTDRGLDFLVVGEPMPDNCVSVPAIAIAGSTRRCSLLEAADHPRSERITKARQAAEALFTPKLQLTEQSVPESLPTADHPARKPRILAISPATSIGREAVETPVSLNQQTMRRS